MVAARVWGAAVIGDELRFHVVVPSPISGPPRYFAAWSQEEAVWADFDGRRLFWLLDEAESVIRHLGIGKVVIERLTMRNADF